MAVGRARSLPAGQLDALAIFPRGLFTRTAVRTPVLHSCTAFRGAVLHCRLTLLFRVGRGLGLGVDGDPFREQARELCHELIAVHRHFDVRVQVDL